MKKHIEAEQEWERELSQGHAATTVYLWKNTFFWTIRLIFVSVLSAKNVFSAQIIMKPNGSSNLLFYLLKWSYHSVYIFSTELL